MNDQHHHIAQQHIKLKGLFIDFCQHTKLYIENRNDVAFVQGGDGFNSITLYVHGRKVGFHFSMVFQPPAIPLGQVCMVLEEPDQSATEIGLFLYDYLGNLKKDRLSSFNIGQEEAAEKILLLAADSVVKYVTVKD
jgi:hypothetical protein